MNVIMGVNSSDKLRDTTYAREIKGKRRKHSESIFRLSISWHIITPINTRALLLILPLMYVIVLKGTMATSVAPPSKKNAMLISRHRLFTKDV